MSGDFDNDAFDDDVMSDIERRHDLERKIRVGAQIRLDIEQSGPLAGYLRDRRRLALGALSSLASTDPQNAIEIAQAQAVVREYLNVRDWIGEHLTAGEQAKATIRDEFDDETEDETTDVED